MGAELTHIRTIRDAIICILRSTDMTDDLPPELARGAIQNGKEFAWPVEAFPVIVAAAPGLGLRLSRRPVSLLAIRWRDL